jgi:two-component system, NarL family, nitrate/nitrite response regulator NarL
VSAPNRNAPLAGPTGNAAADATPQPIRVMLAEDHAITLWGLQRLIEGQPERAQVIGTADSCAALLAHPLLAQAQVLVMDLDLGHSDSLDVLPEVLRRTAAQVLVLTASDDAQRHCRAVALGARGVLHKSEAPQQILLAIEQVSRGAAWLAPQLMGMVLNRLASPAGAGGGPAQPQDARQRRISSLTEREREIVRVLSQNASEKLLGVAGQLGMSENTLRNHLTAVYSKLGVRGRLELHVFASENGLNAG